MQKIKGVLFFDCPKCLKKLGLIEPILRKTHVHLEDGGVVIT